MSPSRKEGRLWGGLHFLSAMAGFMHTNALFCHSVTAHYVRKEERVQPVNLYHWRAGCCVVSRVTCREHRAHSSVRVPVPQITSHLRLGEISHHRWWVSPRRRSEQAGTINPEPDPGSLTAPAGVQKLQLEAQVPPGCLLQSSQPGSI